MQKQPRIISRRHISVCPHIKGLFPLPSPMPRIVFSRHLGRMPVYHTNYPGITVYYLPCGWFIWRYASGARQLSVLPF